MSEIVDKSLGEIARGAGIVLVGTILGMGFAFISKILIVRYITQSQYGLYSLGLTLISIVGTISTLGVKIGVPRQISHYQETDGNKIPPIVSSSLLIGVGSSLVFALGLFVFAKPISVYFFNFFIRSGVSCHMLFLELMD